MVLKGDAADGVKHGTNQACVPLVEVGTTLGLAKDGLCLLGEFFKVVEERQEATLGALRCLGLFYCPHLDDKETMQQGYMRRLLLEPS